MFQNIHKTSSVSKKGIKQSIKTIKKETYNQPNKIVYHPLEFQVHSKVMSVYQCHVYFSSNL